MVYLSDDTSNERDSRHLKSGLSNHIQGNPVQMYNKFNGDVILSFLNHL